MKRILYLIAIIFTFCAFSLYIKAEEFENGIEGESNAASITDVETVDETTEEDKSDEAPVQMRGTTDGETEEVVEGPEHEKTLTENEDGTYTIGLTVKGETEEVISTKKVNVVVALDISGSMDDNGVSYTEKEYDYAVSNGIPVLAFLHQDISSLPIGKADFDAELQNKLNNFRQKMETGRLVQYWNNPDDLNAKVAVSIPKTIISAISRSLAASAAGMSQSAGCSPKGSLNSMR